MLRRHCWSTGRADGAKVQDVLAALPHRGGFPGLGGVVSRGPAGRGGDQVPAAVFDGRLEGELLVWTVVLVQLCVPRVLEGGSVRGYAGVKERVFGAEEDGLLLPGVDQVLFTARAPGRSLRETFRSLAFS